MPISIPSGHLPVTQSSRSVPAWDGEVSLVTAKAIRLEPGTKLLVVFFVFGFVISLLSIQYALMQASQPRSLASRRSGWSSRLYEMLARL
jgi:hypothetical protein